jgi:ABC-2 type transport system ATP-binding protein
MRLIDIHNVSRRFGSVQALRGVSLTLESGTIGLVGNNGSGKSTLLKILLGLLSADTGSGTVLGCDLRHSGRQLRGRVGYMPESAAVVSMLKGVELVALSGDLYGMPHREARRRAHEMLDYVGLGELRYRRLDEYSTGNLQRLKLAAALVHDPELLLLDEPTNGLDPIGRAAMLRLIEALIAETDKSVLLCSHLLGDVQKICHQVVVLDRGTVALSGSLDQLQSRIGSRYQVAWQGDGQGYVAALEAHGVQVTADRAKPRAAISVPSGWTTRRLFELARASGVVLVELTEEEEDLERLFYRVTGEPQSVTGESESVAPIGNGIDSVANEHK